MFLDPFPNNHTCEIDPWTESLVIELELEGSSKVLNTLE